MKKIILGFCVLGLCACAFPNTPGEGNLLNGSKEFREPLFESGARGEVIISMSDNVSDDGWFGKNYENVVSFKNMQSGEVYSLKTKLGDKEYDWAMLPIGEYEVTNLYLQYTYTTSQQVGNTTHTTTHIETLEDFQGKSKIRFNVKPGVVSYIGNIELIMPENKIDLDGRYASRTFKIEDCGAKISDKQKKKWEKEFGQSYVVNLATVK
ncbi:MAG: hypothetical protein LBF37_01245 [Rickettsiales bacterium]|jgi:hypothetical protein|nr:hypothetical protein [Rickettsiales bacterium]